MTHKEYMRRCIEECKTCGNLNTASGAERLVEKLAERIDEIDYIPAPAVAHIGQTIVVTAVDKNGRPTEWDTVDMQGDINNIHELLGSGETGQVLSTTDNGVEWQNVTSGGGGDSAGEVLWEDYSCSLVNNELIEVDIFPYRYVEVTFRMAAFSSVPVYRTSGMVVGKDTGAVCMVLVGVSNQSILTADAFLEYYEDEGGFKYQTDYVGECRYSFESGSITGTVKRATPTYPVRIVGYY